MTEQQADYVTEAMELIGITEPRRIAQEVSGFTPIFDVVADAFGNITASVHGCAWRFCQMEDNVCKASLTTMGKLLGLDESTVSRHLKVLVDNGFFIDLTPDLKNRPHVYADTGKVIMKSKITARLADSKATLADSKATLADSKATLAESRMSKHTKKDSKKLKDRATPATPKANSYPELVIFRAVTKRYPNEANWQEVFDAFLKINLRLGRDATKEDLSVFFTAWTRKGYNPQNLDWLLEWAVRGETPANGKIASQWTNNQNGAKHATPANRQPNAAIDPEQFERDRALGQRIKSARQQARV